MDKKIDEMFKKEPFLDFKVLFINYGLSYKVRNHPANSS